MNHLRTQGDDQSSQTPIPGVRPGRARTISLDNLLVLANRFHQGGDLGRAETLYRTILDRHPDHPAALHMLGMVAYQSGNSAEGAKLIEASIERHANDHRAFNNLGNVYQSLDRLDDAIASYETAIGIHADYPEALLNLGSALLKRRDFEGAAERLHRCVDIDPRRSDAHLELGRALRQLGKYTEAQVAFQVAKNIAGDDVMPRFELAETIASLGKTEAAAEEYLAALEIEPENCKLLNGLAGAYKRLGKFEEALDVLERALKLDPLNTETLNNFGSTYQSIGENEKAASYHRKVLEMAPQAEFSEKSYLFVLLNRPEFSPEERFEIHRALRSRHDKPEFTAKAFAKRDRNPDRRIRIGYLSSDFRTHVVALNVLPVISNHDHDRFDVTLYYQYKHDDKLTECFRDYADKFVILTDETNREVADRIEEDEIDILVTLAGRFDENRPLVASYRPAPIQVSYHDCATSGLEAMDYWLTDSVLHPDDTKELFTEELYRLPVFYQYGVQDGLPEVARTPALANGFITFGCFNKPEKINEEIVSLWADVLRAVPNSRILFKYFSHYETAFMRRRFSDMFAADGIGADRLLFKASTDNRKTHLLNYHDVDIALDPFPFNGATTTFEALTMGVPVVALSGVNFVDRVAASIVTHAGFPQFAAEDRADYVEVAARLASDADALDALRQGMRETVHGSRLCDSATYAETVEAAFRDIWRRWCERETDSRAPDATS